MFFERLEERVNAINSLLCVGLDPHPKHLEEDSAEGALRFCRNIIEQTHQYAAAFKPNSAFFEGYGPDGMRVLQQITKMISDLNIPIILDLKRGDIDSTAQQYARAAYDLYHADAVTLSPYMGWDSIEPFVKKAYQGKGAFILCKTSNPSSKDIQDLRLASTELVYEKVATMTDDWAKNQDCALGLVTGATDVIALRRIRTLAPNAWFLCPGVGAQGGNAEAVCQAALRSDGSGLLISVSRGISDPKAAGEGRGMAEVAREFRDYINQYRSTTVITETQPQSQDLPQYQTDFIDLAIQNRVLQFGSFKLKSGRISPYFFNAGLFCGGRSMSLMCRSYAQAIRSSGLNFDVIFGPAYKGIPLAAGVAMAWYELYQEDKEFAYNRKEVKDHGEGGTIIGANISGKRILIVDDVITAGTAIRESLEILQQAQSIVTAVVVALDREETTSVTQENSPDLHLSAIQQIELQYGIPVVSVIRLSNLIQYMQNRREISFNQVQIDDIKSYREEYGSK